MARYSGPACRLCRRQGMKLFLKGTKCMTEKCPFNKRGFPPGQHGQNRIKLSDYGLQLREKQRVKFMYGLMERQFRVTFARASRMPGRTGENLLQLLERRLDNVVFRLGFATSRAQARMTVRQGHSLVNDRRCDIPSFQVKPGMTVRIAGTEKFMKALQDLRELTKERPLPLWLERPGEEPMGKVAALPGRGDISIPVQEQLIVELYSK